MHVENATVVYMVITDTLADRILRQTEEQNKQEIVTVFNNAYNLTLQPSNILSLFLPDWDINPLYFGSYSNNPVGVTNETFATLLKPLRGRLFFSGEALSLNYSGFVHGGYLSGIEILLIILSLKYKVVAKRELPRHLIVPLDDHYCYRYMDSCALMNF